MPRVGLGFEPDADDEDEDHLIKPLIAHVYKTLGRSPSARTRAISAARSSCTPCSVLPSSIINWATSKASSMVASLTIASPLIPEMTYGADIVSRPRSGA